MNVPFGTRLSADMPVSLTSVGVSVLVLVPVHASRFAVCMWALRQRGSWYILLNCVIYGFTSRLDKVGQPRRPPFAFCLAPRPSTRGRGPVWRGDASRPQPGSLIASFSSAQTSPLYPCTLEQFKELTRVLFRPVFRIPSPPRPVASLGRHAPPSFSRLPSSPRARLSTMLTVAFSWRPQLWAGPSRRAA